MQLVSYEPKYKQDFIQMNNAQISSMFVIENEDLRELENIEPCIKLGGQIFFALDDSGKVIAC